MKTSRIPSLVFTPDEGVKPGLDHLGVHDGRTINLYASVSTGCMSCVFDESAQHEREMQLGCVLKTLYFQYVSQKAQQNEILADCGVSSDWTTARTSTYGFIQAMSTVL